MRKVERGVCVRQGDLYHVVPIVDSVLFLLPAGPIGDAVKDEVKFAEASDSSRRNSVQLLFGAE